MWLGSVFVTLWVIENPRLACRTNVAQDQCDQLAVAGGDNYLKRPVTALQPKVAWLSLKLNGRLDLHDSNTCAMYPAMSGNAPRPGSIALAIGLLGGAM